MPCSPLSSLRGRRRTPAPVFPPAAERMPAHGKPANTYIPSTTMFRRRWRRQTPCSPPAWPYWIDLRHGKRGAVPTHRCDRRNHLHGDHLAWRSLAVRLEQPQLIHVGVRKDSQPYHVGILDQRIRQPPRRKKHRRAHRRRPAGVFAKRRRHPLPAEYAPSPRPSAFAPGLRPVGSQARSSQLARLTNRPSPRRLHNCAT